jgi:hypothetical protein
MDKEWLLLADSLRRLAKSHALPKLAKALAPNCSQSTPMILWRYSSADDARASGQPFD